MTVQCEAQRYSRARCSETPPAFDVVYRRPTTNVELDRHPACFTHALAEVERHHASNGIAACDMEEHRR